MKLAPERTAAIHGLLDNIAEHVAAARMASDTDAARKALNPVWHLLHDAQTTLNEAERELRSARLAQLTGADA